MIANVIQSQPEAPKTSMRRRAFQFDWIALFAVAILACAMPQPAVAQDQPPQTPGQAPAAQPPSSQPSPRSSSPPSATPPSQTQKPADANPPASNSPAAKPGAPASDAPAYDPFHAQQDVDVGEFYLHKGDVDAAIGRFEDAIRLRDNFAQPRLLLAECYEKKHNTAKALRYYKEYLKVYPDAPDRKKVEKKIEKLSN
jgi:tetratricopeptide (TPR) repeat protein